jgi:hypothetical protein
MSVNAGSVSIVFTHEYLRIYRLNYDKKRSFQSAGLSKKDER